LTRPRLILASASPRRRELLAALGVDFDAIPPEIEEQSDGAPPEELVLANARLKAQAVAGQVGEGHLVLGVDTDVALDGRIMGKAETKAEASTLLTQLSGRTHEVLTGLVLLGPAGVRERTAVESTRVTFVTLSEDLLAPYVASGEWRDRAGAYAVQGLGSMLVERVEGDLSNVIGLPLQRLFELAPEITGKP
jgi:septum formation protein